MLETIIQAVVTFAATNIDDIFLLTILFSVSETRSKIIIGQLLGMTVLIIVSVLGAYFASLILSAYTWILGFIPVILGIRYFLRNESDEHVESLGIIGAMLLMISNGSDNIGVYIPLFTTLSVLEVAVTALIYLSLTLLLTVISIRASDLSFINTIVSKYSRVIVPIVLIAIGAFVIIEGVV